MRALATLDYVVIATYLVAVFAFGIVLTRRAGQSIENFFVGGRNMAWWLVGVSMAATNFSIDTPIAVTQIVAEEGVSGVWFTWSIGISALLVTFLFSRLWSRSGVLTDAEIIELRYSGKPAAALRLFKGLYFGLIFNVFIMGWVFLALIKVMTGLTDLDIRTLLIGATALVFVYTLASGFYGVVLTDFFQYFIALLGSITLAFFAVRKVGGLGAVSERLTESFDPSVTRFVPELSAENLGPASIFLTCALVQWWAHKYSDGGGKHIQRMLSARSERDAFAGSLLYSFLNYTVQVWPWVLTALCGLALFGSIDDPQLLYSMVMAEVLPAGLLGLVLVSLVGAFMSTIDSHLNLGASYLVNDIYRRFLVRDASERHYVLVSRLMMAGLLGVAIFIALNIDSVAGTWKFLLTFASGAGLTWIVRWFWWRVNAWTEFSGMVTSGVVASYLQLRHADWLYSQKLLTTVGITTVVWLTVTFLTAPVAEERLVSFLAKIRPGSPGWSAIRRRHGLESSSFFGDAVGQWALALVGLLGLNFAIGSVLLGRLGQAGLLLTAAVLALGALYRRLKH